MANTGEDEKGLRKIMDLTRMMSIAILLIHTYYYCYRAFDEWNLSATISDTLLKNIAKTGLFESFQKAKLIALGLLIISLLGVKGRKKENLKFSTSIIYMAVGIFIYFLSYLFLESSFDPGTKTIGYIAITATGFLFFLSGGTLLSRIIKQRLSTEVFNKENETFPQEERFLNNEYSINLPARYNLKGKIRKSWINIINPFRALLVIGSPGSGKSFFVINHVIRQHIKKGFSMFVYDFKYDDLTKITYNALQQYKHLYKVRPEFYVINFDDLSKSNRCNPLDPSTMFDITDAAESSRTIMMGLNREWIKRQGDFFVESPINFLTAIIWFLRKYQDGAFCTLPHVIELMQVEYDKLFTVLRTEPEIEALINPFVTAYMNDVMEQLEGQIAAAKIAMARLASPQLYYVLSGNDFTLDINNVNEPKIVCMGNNPQKQQVYGAVLSLYITRLIKVVNKKGGIPSSLIFDEFPTIYFQGMDGLIATARSNKVATTLAVQDYSQLKKDYGREQAEVIMNIAGNVISGQVMGDTAKQLSERFGKIMQDRTSLSINMNDTSVSKSKQLEAAVPPSAIASLSSGEFVGMVADNPDQKIELKTFHCEILNKHPYLQYSSSTSDALPIIRKIDPRLVSNNYNRVKVEVQQIIDTEFERIFNTPGLESVIIKK
ncbi:MAG: conjugal transfer protein TraG [Bacteroidetes bacterium]|nr:MAG: conjugal transfer protein TraG [Bacteroidota bacterium]